MGRITHAIKERTTNAKIEAKKELDILRALRTGKPLLSYIGWTGHNNLGDEILFDAHKMLFPEFAFVPFRPNSLAERYYRLKGKTLYAGGFFGGGTLINQNAAWLEKISCLQNKNLPMFCMGTGVTEMSFRASFETTPMQVWVDMLNTLNFVGVRGPRSRQLLNEAGFTNLSIVGDTALALAPAKMPKLASNKVVGFNYGLTGNSQIWGDSEKYAKNIAIAIKQLIKKGYEIRLLPVWDADIASNKQLVELVNDPKCTMRVHFDSFDGYTKELEECNLFIGQKLHATIQACMQRIPSIMIEYQPKCRDFMASVGMEKYVIKTSECTPKALLAMLDELEQKGGKVQKTLDGHITEYQTIQRKAAKKISRQLSK